MYWAISAGSLYDMLPPIAWIRSAAMPATCGAAKLVSRSPLAATRCGDILPVGCGSGTGPRELLGFTFGRFDVELLPDCQQAWVVTFSGIRDTTWGFCGPGNEFWTRRVECLEL